MALCKNNDFFGNIHIIANNKQQVNYQVGQIILIKMSNTTVIKVKKVLSQLRQICSSFSKSVCSEFLRK
jgi:hypothetical protein